jgi:biotin carboxyl carrier protein
MSGHEFHWRMGDQEFSCRIEGSRSDGVFHISGKTLPFRFLDSGFVEISGRRHRFYVTRDRESTTVWLDGRTYQLERAEKTVRAAAVTSPGTGEVRALMPGKLLRLMVKAGDIVKEKQTVAIMESMKMESALVAPKPGHVSEIRFNPADVVEMGDVVMVIEAD